jgi:hypothetical protein
MTWGELKRAVEDAGINEEDNICEIQCQIHQGDKHLHPVRLGRALKLAEGISESALQDALGCCV